MNPLYLHVDHVNGYIEEKVVNKYLVFDTSDENKELLTKYNDVFNGIKNQRSMQWWVWLWKRLHENLIQFWW